MPELAAPPHAAQPPPATVSRGPDALAASGVAAGYDGRDVVAEVSLAVPPGRAVRLVGGNGAGKSTLVRALAGAQELTAGRVLVLGADLETEPLAARRQLGHATGSPPFPYLTGREHLRLAGRVFGFGPGPVQALCAQVPDWACVRGLDEQVRTYSHGMRQQLSLLLALVHAPGLLLLDEALDGLDDQTLGQAAALLRARLDSGAGLVFVEHRGDVARLLAPYTEHAVHPVDRRDL